MNILPLHHYFQLKIKALIAIIFCIYFLSIPGFLYAEGIPQQINYQGKLFEDNKAVTGTKAFHFRFSEENWSETHENVDVVNGYYNVVLGKKKAIPQEIFDNYSEVHLEISVDGRTLSPQIDVVSVAYAFKAAVADNTRKIAGNPVTGKPEKDQVLQWNGSEWTPKTLENSIKNISLGSGLSNEGSKEEPTVSIKDKGISGDHLAENIVDSSKIIDRSIQKDDIGFTIEDNLGNHTASQNIQTNDFWISNDGTEKGIFVAEDGNVGIGTKEPENALDVEGNMKVNGSLNINGTINAIDTNGQPFLSGYLRGCRIEYFGDRQIRINRGFFECSGTIYQIKEMLRIDLENNQDDKIDPGLYEIYFNPSKNKNKNDVKETDFEYYVNVLPDWNDDYLGLYHPTNKRNRCIGYFNHTGTEISYCGLIDNTMQVFDTAQIEKIHYPPACAWEGRRCQDVANGGSHKGYIRLGVTCHNGQISNVAILFFDIGKNDWPGPCH